VADTSAAARELLDRARNDWVVFEELVRIDEPKRRDILRSHREARVIDKLDIRTRERVDAALDCVMLLELGMETGVLTELRRLRTITGLQQLLMESPAFVRYLDTYLSFSVRFVAERLCLPFDPPRSLSDKGRATSTPDDVNEVSVPWPAPPPILQPHAAFAEPAMQKYLASLGPSIRDRQTVKSMTDDEENIYRALRFLDDFIVFSNEQAEYELWLKGLRRKSPHERRFRRITQGLWAFARQKARFYESLEGRKGIERWRQEGQVAGGWSAKNPLTARFALTDLYWLARLLRAEVSPAGVVVYTNGSWLQLIAERTPVTLEASELKPEYLQAASSGEAESPTRARSAGDSVVELEEVLRAVFDFACDLVQNASDNARARLERFHRPADFPETPGVTVSWRVACDEELAEISQQRKERLIYDDQEFEAESTVIAHAEKRWWKRTWDRAADRYSRLKRWWSCKQEMWSAGKEVWSRRIRTGNHVHDLVGLAFSGGGIRSATFNLGVLQGLQELDLLRQVDYLSTVSGGGYIGAWLLASVHRTRYWLTRPTDWGPSIDHLRRFSNYLAPRTGLMSADTWSMWGSWIRNAFLIQLSAISWLALLMVATSLGKVVFETSRAITAYRIALSLLLALLTMAVCINMRRRSDWITESLVLKSSVIPTWLASFFTAAVLWAAPPVFSDRYSEIVAYAYLSWLTPLTILFASCWILAWSSFEKAGVWRAIWSFGATLVSVLVIYLGICALSMLFVYWHGVPGSDWYAFTAGPPLVLAVMTVGVMVMLGLLGHAAEDWRREWWTRFGSWLGIYGVGFLALSAVTIFGPLFIMWASELPWKTVKWGAVLGWIATVVGGLLAGDSSQTDLETEKKWTTAAIGWFARFAAFAFIVGFLLVVATVLHLVLLEVTTVDPLLTVGSYWPDLRHIKWSGYLEAFGLLFAVGMLSSWRFEINVFGLNQFYRNRLVRCYLGATRWAPGRRMPHKFTGFDQQDDLLLSKLRRKRPDVVEPKADATPYRGPFPIINCSLNLGGSSDLALHTRHSASFVLTPLRCGADRPAVGYAPTGGAPGGDSFAGGVNLGQAVSVSGAAASPNMGYDTSPIVAFLLTMFNVRLAWWFPNPGKKLWWASWLPFSLIYLVKETFALADETSYFVNVSDGGHFENLGIYELVRRRCKVIIASDAECDGELAFGSLGRVVRMCQTDFGACIEIDVESIRRQKESGRSGAHCAVGRITYANGSRGYLIYLKSSMTGDEDVSVEQYHASHADFPHEPTGDQFFAEDQFESYRRLGHHITTMAFRGVERERSVLAMATKLVDLWAPASAANESFVDQTEALAELWKELRTNEELLPLMRELHDIQTPAPKDHTPTDREYGVCLELIQLMENAFLDLRLDEFWTHPDNRGWVKLFTMWAQSPTFRAAYDKYKDVFGKRFVYFCGHRLGL